MLVNRIPEKEKSDGSRKKSDSLGRNKTISGRPKGEKIMRTNLKNATRLWWTGLTGLTGNVITICTHTGVNLKYYTSGLTSLHCLSCWLKVLFAKIKMKAEIPIGTYTLLQRRNKHSHPTYNDLREWHSFIG